MAEVVVSKRDSYENDPPVNIRRSSCIGPYGAYELDDRGCSHWPEHRGEGFDELLEGMEIVEREEMNMVGREVVRRPDTLIPEHPMPHFPVLPSYLTPTSL